jgi:hypothetical protein
MSTPVTDPYMGVALGVEAAWLPLPKHNTWLGPLLESLRNPPVRPFPSTQNTD